MHIALCSPVAVDLLDKHLEHSQPLIKGYSFPLASYLVIKLLERNHRVTVVSISYEIQKKKEWRSLDQRLRVIVLPRRHLYFVCLDAYRREVNAMCHELRMCRPDIVHAQWTYEFADAGLSSGLPCLVTANDAPWIIARQFHSLYRLYRAIYESIWIAPRLSYMTSVSTHIDSVFRKEPFFKPQKTWIVPNGIDAQFVVKCPKQRVVNPLSPVFFGLKNPIPLLRAFQYVRSVLPTARLYLSTLSLGGRFSLDRYVVRNKRFEGVEWVEPLPNHDLLRFLEEQVDVVVHTSREESFSMMVLESMAKGIPVIGGRNSGAVPYVLGDGSAGVLVDIQSSREIADAMLRLVQDTAFYQQIATQALARARECFLLDNMVSEYERVYSEILKNAKGF